MAFSTRSSATSAHGNGLSISLCFYKIRKRPDEQRFLALGHRFFFLLGFAAQTGKTVPSPCLFTCDSEWPASKTRKTPPSFPLAVRRRGHMCGGPNLSQHRKNRASFGVWNRVRYEEKTRIQVTRQGQEKRGEGRQASRKDSVTSDTSLRFSLSSKANTKKRKNEFALRLSVFRLASFFLSLSVF